MNWAGWAAGDITPPLGLPMGGRGPRFAAGSEILSPLQAGVTILQDAVQNRVVLVSADVISFDTAQNDALRLAIAAAVKTAPDAVIINASHTHSGPMLSYERYATLKPKPQPLADYERELDEKLLRLAIEAAQNLQPVQAIWRDGESNIGINRRVSTPEGIVMAPNPDGFYHRQLWTLDLQSLEDSGPRCVLFSHGCHPVIVYSSQWTAISSEWPGRSREILHEKLGRETHFQFLQGLAGNIRPRILADFENQKFRSSTPEDLETTAQEFACDVGSTLAKDGAQLQLQLGACRDYFVAHRAAPPPRVIWEKMAASEDELAQELGNYWQTRYGENAIAPYESQPWPIGLLRFAPSYALVTFAGEPLSEWIQVLRRALPDQHLVACGYTHSSAGYLPTDELLAQGGYEVERSAPYSKSGPGALLPGLDDAVTKTLHKMRAFIEAT